MVEINLFAKFLSESEVNKPIKSFEDLKTILSNEILIQYQYDLPKEFNLTDILLISRNHRYMRNFSKTLSYLKSYDFLKNELSTFFNYAHPPVENKNRRSQFASKPDSYTFKQIFFNIEQDDNSKIIVDDITDYNLQNATLNSLKDAITDFEELKDKKFITKENKPLISSDKQQKLIETNFSNITPTLVEDAELDNLFKNFQIQTVKPPIVEEKSEGNDTKDQLLDETFKLLGLGSIKKNLGKSIIIKKKKEGLLFDEWVKENLDWVQFLIKKLLHIDYLSLKDESHFINIARNYLFSDDFTEDIQKLFKVLQIDNNN